MAGEKKLRVVVADPLHPRGWKKLREQDDIAIHGPFDCDADLRSALAEADALLICADTRVDGALLSSAPKLKIVARAGARLDNVDIDEATRRGIQVLHVPEANVVAVVEYTFLLMLAMARQGGRLDEGGGFDSEELGFELAGKSLGIIGFGRQGREVARRAQAFGMYILAYDPYIDLSFAREQQVEVVDLPELLTRADIITLHTAYTEKTRHILDEKAFARMKRGAYLINCIHSGLIDEAALVAALDGEQLAGVALDVWDQESLSNSSLLLDHPKVWVSRNRKIATREAQEGTAVRVVSDMLHALRGDDYHNVVNLPFDEAMPYRRVKPYIDLAVKLGKLQGQLAEGWIRRVEVELLGEGLESLVRPVAAVLLSGMIRRVDERPVNWVSAPVLAFEQGIVTSQTKGLVSLVDYPALIACRVYWEGGQRTVAGALFGNGEARLVAYDHFEVDAYPNGYVLILENEDVPGVIGKVGTRLSRERINIAQWRYGREKPGGRAVSFINLDQRVPEAILTELEKEPEIHQARLVRL